MTIVNKTPLLESNNYKLFSSGKNKYIKGALVFSVNAGKENPAFIRITFRGSLYIDMGGAISWEEYEKLSRSLTLLSLAGNITFSLQKGWLASDWVYSGKDCSCSCVLSRSELPEQAENEEYALKIGDIVTFGLEYNADISFEFYSGDKKLIGAETLSVFKTFDSLNPNQNTVKSTTYTLSKTDAAKLLWTERINGIDTPKEETVKAFDAECSYKSFKKANGSLTLSYMPPQIEFIKCESGKISWNTAFCTKTLIRFNNGSFADATNKKEYSVTWNSQKFVHLRFCGYLYQIDKVIYNTGVCGISGYAEELSQTVYVFEDSGMRLMRLEWKNKSTFGFFVAGTAQCSDYIVKADSTSWEFPFQIAGEDYSAVYIYADKAKKFQLLL